MKRSIFTFIGIFLTTVLFSQTILFQENFEGATIGFTSSSVKNNNSWAISSQLSTQGLKSDSAKVGLADTTYLTSTTFSCANMSFVQLEFDQIAKIYYSDAATIEVSADNGNTWTQLTGGQYLGTGQFGNVGNKFTSTSYINWLPGTNNAIPTNSWWHHETFNISSLVADSSQVKFRFVLTDVNSTGAAGNYGWLIDSVKITASFSELIPPTISLIPPYPHDTAYTSGPFDVIAQITDNTGIDTAMVIYSTTTGVTDTLGMNLIGIDTFKASIPFYGYGRSITYYVKAIDSSPAHNIDSVGPYTFFCKYSPGGTFVVGNLSTITTSTSGNPFGQFYTGNKEQFLILASELQALGAAGGNISSIGFNVTTVNSATSSGSNHDGFTIKIKSTSSSALSTTFETGLTQVYSTSSYQTVTGWNTFTFTTPFVWDGVSNVVIETCFDNGSSNWSNNASINTNLTTFNSVTYKFSDASTNECIESSGSTLLARPDMQLAMATPTNITNDIGVYQITNPTGGVVANQAFPIKVRVKNFGVDTITSGTVNWKFDGVAQTAYSLQDTILPDSLSSEILLGSKTVSGAGSHSLLTWTDNPNGVGDFNVANDSSSINFYACANLLSGTYTLGGTNSDYATFADAVLALNQCGISGPVTFNIAAGTYNEHFELLPINGSSATNTVTFKAANGDSSSVILNYDAAGTADNYVIKLNGASYVTIKNMTIQAADTNYCKAIVLGGVLHDVNIKNNIVKTLIPQYADDANTSLISTLDSIGGNIDIEQNAMINGSRGVNLFSNASRSGWVINDNIFDGQYAQGVRLLKGHSSVVSGNIFTMDTTSGTYQAVVLNTCDGSAQVYQNHILTTQSLVGYGVIMASSVFDSISHARVYNNMIQLNGNSSANTLSCGILINNAANVDVYFNTVHMTGNQTLAASMCMFDQGTTPNSDYINIKNNIFTNTAGGYLYYIQAVDSSEYSNDYNDMYNWGTGNFGYISGIAVADFVDWKTKTGEGLNSDTIDPYYASAIDLHIANNLINGRAMPITGITTDFDGDIRNTTNPDMGADEFIPSPYDVTALEVVSPLDACGLDTNETVIVSYKNIGSVNINGNITGSYQLMGSSAIVTENITDTIAPGDTLDFVFSTKVNLSVANIGYDSTFTIRAWATLIGDNIHQNDTTMGDVASGYVPGLVTIADDTIQYGERDTLYASGNNIYWWEYDTSSTELINDTVFITPNLYDTTTYWVSDRAGSGLQSIQIGTGTNVNSTTGYPSPYGQFYTGCKEQYLILASELTAMGAVAGPIESLAFDVVAVNSATSAGHNHDNYTIKLKNTTLSSLSSSFETGLTQTYTVSTYQTVSGWNTHQFTTPFFWDGTSNLIVEVCFDNYVTSSSYSLNATVNRSSTTFISAIDYHSDGGSVCPHTTGSTHTTRPNMKFIIHGQGCYGDRSPVTVYINGYPQYDAGLDSNLLSPVGSVPSGVQSEIKGILHNYGQVTMTSVQIPWKLNGVPQDTLFWTGSLAFGDIDTVVIDTAIFGGGIYNVQAYTMLPNNVIDTFNTNDTAYSNFNSCLNGTYTIGNLSAGADFASFNAAISALQNAGICGNVIINVDSGAYTEQLVIPSIMGMGANNTVTFQGATGDSTEVILQYSATSSSADYTLKFNGAEYFTFKNMTIKALGASYGGVIEIGGGSKHNTIMNNIIESTVSTSSYARCIYSSSGNDDYTTIDNNMVLNGYYAIYMGGNSSANLEKGTVIKNNIIDGFYYYGIYTRYQDSIQIKSNYIEDGATSNYGYAIYCYYCDNETRVVGNVLNLSPNNYKYGIQMYYSDGTSAKRGLIANNMISITDGTGSNFGLYFYNSSHIDVYYNSINITSGSSSSRAAYFYVPNSIANVNVENNIFRDSIGYTVYMNSYSGISSFDYNSYYSTANNFAYWNGNKADLAALQSASNKDVHSVTVDPQFFSNSDLHMLSTQLSGLGNPIAAVTDDIDGEQRSAIGTTIGADEVPLLPYDIGVSAILLVPDTTIEGQTITFKVEVKNYGTDTVNGFNINYSINGGTAVVYNYNTPFPPAMIDTVQLVSFTSPAGNAQICATTVLATDSNAFNDGTCKNFFGIPAKDAYLTRIEEILGGCGLTTDTVTIWVKNIGIDTINGSNSAMPTVSYKSNTAATVTENFTSVIVPGDSAQHIFQTAVNLATNNYIDSTFNIAAWIDWTGDNVSYNDTAYTSVFSSHTPLAPIVVSPVNVPYGSWANLSATSSDTILWYQSDTSTNYFHVGSSYTTGFNYADDTLWLASMNGASNLKITETVQFKTGSGYTNPYPSYFPSSDFDGLEITNMGSAPQNLGGWSIHLRGSQTINYTFPAGTILNAGEVMTCIYGSSVSLGTTGNNMFGIATTTFISSSSQVGYFLKDDQGAVIDAFASNGYTFLSSDGITSADWSGSITGLGGQAGAVRLISDNNNASDWGGTNSNTSSFGAYNTQLSGGSSSMGNGCTSVRVPLIIHVTGQLAADVGAIKLIAPVSQLSMTSTQNVTIRVKNFGTAAQSNIPVGYQMNGGATNWDTITSTINPNDSLDFTFSATANMSNSGQTYTFKAFTALMTPLDSNQLNDTVNGSATNLLPNYCVCSATSTGYEDLTGVSVGTWSYTNTATGALYTDYTSVMPIANIAPSVTYPVTISSGFPPGYSYSFTCYANMFIDFNRDGDFDDAGELVFGGTTNSNNTISGTITVPVTALSGLTRMRIVLRESGSQSNTGPCGTFTWGEAEDYNIYIMTPIPNDAGVEQIYQPNDINTSANVPVLVKVRNYGTQSWSSIPVTYTLNNGTPVTIIDTNTIAPLDTVIVSLGNITLQSGSNALCVYTQLPGDSNLFNDQSCKNPFLEATVNLSYVDNFEGSNLWRKEANSGNQWQRGIPQMVHISSAHSPTNVWAIDLDSTYANNSDDKLYSPKILIPSFADSTYLKFWHFYDVQSNDGGFIQYRINSSFWANLGYVGDPNGTNWVNTNVGGTHMWSGSNSGWIHSAYTMNFISAINPFFGANGDTVQFRFVFHSNGSGNSSDGWAIDDFEVSLPLIAQDGGVIAISSPDTSSQTGSQVTVTIVVKNFGTANLTSIPVAYDINNSGNWVTATFTPATPLMPDSTASYTFSTGYTSPSAAYQICAKTSVVGDVYVQNDQFCKSVGVTAAPVDGGVSQLMVTPVWLGPIGGIDTTKVTKNVTPSVYIQNYGSTPLTNFDVEYSLNSGWTTETFTGTIQPGDSALHTFATNYVSPIGSYTLHARTVITNDADVTNDQSDKSLYGVMDVGMDENPNGGFYVNQNEPNPANGVVSISYFISNGGKVKFELRNTLGQLLINKESDEIAGSHSIKIDADKLAAGVYYYTVEYNNMRRTLKMVVSR